MKSSVELRRTWKEADRMYGWRVKLWKFKTTKESKTQNEAMKEWIKKHRGRYQIRYVWVNNAWAVEYRPLLFF